MWLKLTLVEGNKPVRVNMSNVTAYYPNDDGGALVDLDGENSYPVKETPEYIDGFIFAWKAS